MKSVSFSGATQAEAKEKAKKWWFAQSGLTKIRQWEFMVQHGPGRFSPNDEGQWSTTIQYEVA